MQTGLVLRIVSTSSLFERTVRVLLTRSGAIRGCWQVPLGRVYQLVQHGSLVMRLTDFDVGQIPTVIFGTVNGVIGVIASLSHEQYLFLEKLQSNLVKVIKGIEGLSHDQWRSFNNEKRTMDAKNFLDGDLIESFLDLSRNRMNEVSKAMGVSIEELCKRVEELTRLH